MIFLFLFASLSSLEAYAGSCSDTHTECTETVLGQLIDDLESEKESSNCLFICKKCSSSKLFLSANILLQEVNLLSTLGQNNPISQSLDSFASGIFRPPIFLL